MIMPKTNQIHLPKKHNIYTRDLKKFDRENFLIDVMAIDWNLTLVKDDANLSFNQFLTKINQIIDKHMPLHKMSNKEYKMRLKPWITKGILNSINRKNKLYNKYSKIKNQEFKKEIYE